MSNVKQFINVPESPIESKLSVIIFLLVAIAVLLLLVLILLYVVSEPLLKLYSY